MRTPQQKPKGFASLSQARRIEISRKGGIAAHKSGKAHEWNSETARIAGRKGGSACRDGSPRDVSTVEDIDTDDE